MKKNLLFILMLFLSISTASAQVDFVWGKQFGTSNWDGINGLFIIQDKGVVVSGCMNNPMCQSFCKMYNEDGLLLWSRNFIAQGVAELVVRVSVLISRAIYIMQVIQEQICSLN